jgi:hypothetical protein
MQRPHRQGLQTVSNMPALCSSEYIPSSHRQRLRYTNGHLIWSARIERKRLALIHNGPLRFPPLLYESCTFPPYSVTDVFCMLFCFYRLRQIGNSIHSHPIFGSGLPPSRRRLGNGFNSCFNSLYAD